ncbi:MAG: glycosyltransferase [Chloroflexi bacterium]|nr:glycosyltransferase [Chloroflexota bacterium]
MTEHTLPKIAIIMAHAGGGHVTAARSLAEALEGKAQVVFLNLLDEHAPFPLNHLSAAYGPWVNYAPWTYQKIYELFSAPWSVEMIQRAAYPFVRNQVAAVLKAVAADLVISVHSVQVTIPLRALREISPQTPFVTVVTDPVTPPIAWFASDADLCVVATEPARKVALACGLPADRVQVIGLPVRRAFLTVCGQPKAALRAQLGLDPALRTVLLTGGGAGIGKLLAPARAIAGRLAASRTPAQMAIIAGNNRELLKRLRAQQWPLPVMLLGYVENMAEWMAASDLLITKAGPGTLAEAACVGLPVLITEFIPGQEAGNVSWVVDHQAGVYAPKPEQVAPLVDELLRPGNPQLELMAGQALNIARCDASEKIAQAALALYHRTAEV